MEAVIVIFFLLFAILAFGWFYLQRAKARDAQAAGAAAGGDVVASTPAPAPEPTEPEATHTDQPAS